MTVEPNFKRKDETCISTNWCAVLVNGVIVHAGTHMGCARVANRKKGIVVPIRIAIPTEQVIAIVREMYFGGVTQPVIAIVLGLTQPYVCKLIHRFSTSTPCACAYNAIPGNTEGSQRS